MDLAGGSLIFLAFLIAYTLAVIYGLYSRRGSGISQRPYANAYSNAPGAKGASSMSGRRAREVMDWSRGTR